MPGFLYFTVVQFAGKRSFVSLRSERKVKYHPRPVRGNSQHLNHAALGREQGTINILRIVNGFAIDEGNDGSAGNANVVEEATRPDLRYQYPGL